MKISVILPAFNEALVIREQLEALATQECPCEWEVIVADNGSSDDTVEIVSEFAKTFPRLRLVNAADRKGAAHARNRGAQASTGDYLAFIDADDVADEGWLAAIAEALKEHDFVASRFDCERLNPQSGRRCSQTERLQEYIYPRFLPHSGGCGLAVRRQVHEKVNGFDESIRFCEDTDYCWRIQLAGTPLTFAPNALVHIRLPTDQSNVNRQAREWAEANVLLYKLYQNRGMPRLRLAQGLRSWLDLLKRVPELRYSSTRAVWLRNFNWRLGRLKGSFKHRVVAL